MWNWIISIFATYVPYEQFLGSRLQILWSLNLESGISILTALGWLYLTVNHLAFYSFILGTETKILVRWTDVVEIEALPAALLQGKRSFNFRRTTVKSFSLSKCYTRSLCSEIYIRFSVIFGLHHIKRKVGSRYLAPTPVFKLCHCGCLTYL
jgi:hypothetical protein